jgi:hypothetical protein
VKSKEPKSPGTGPDTRTSWKAVDNSSTFLNFLFSYKSAHLFINAIISRYMPQHSFKGCIFVKSVANILVEVVYVH